MKRKSHKKAKTTVEALVEEFTQTNDKDQEVDCVRVRCTESGQSRWSWGNGNNSINRALAMLTARCNCGAKYHVAEEEDSDY